MTVLVRCWRADVARQRSAAMKSATGTAIGDAASSWPRQFSKSAASSVLGDAGKGQSVASAGTST